MRRRHRPRTEGIPEQLCRFVPAEWPGNCPHEQLNAWKDACAGWLAADSARQPDPRGSAEYNRWWLAGWSRRKLPFGDYGCAIDLLREAERYNRQMPPCPHEYRPAQYRGPAEGR